jgi:glucokinase
MILAGDAGGTKTALGLFEPVGDGLAMVRSATFLSAEHPSLDDILAAFLGEQTSSSSPGVACLGVAGPVIDGKCHVTNLGWQLDEAMLARAIGVRRVKLLNDLEATAYGMLHLSPDQLVVLNIGVQPRRAGNIAVIAAGTGLGEAMLYWDGSTYHPMASEGGHVGFAPNTDQEIDLLRFLRRELAGHVSYERVISGPGLHNIYRFLRQSEKRPEPAWLCERLTAGDPSAAIAEAGLAGTDPVCVATLDLFSSIYGAEAGNLALKCLAMGGVFVAGGIAPKLLAVLQNGSFMRGFTDKARFADVVQSIQVSVALDPRAALIGAAYFALRL